MQPVPGRHTQSAASLFKAANAFEGVLGGGEMDVASLEARAGSELEDLMREDENMRESVSKERWLAALARRTGVEGPRPAVEQPNGAPTRAELHDGAQIVYCMPPKGGSALYADVEARWCSHPQRPPLPVEPPADENEWWIGADGYPFAVAADGSAATGGTTPVTVLAFQGARALVVETPGGGADGERATNLDSSERVMRSAILLERRLGIDCVATGDGSRQGGVDAAVDDDESVGTELSVTSGGLIAMGDGSPVETFGVKEIDERGEKDAYDGELAARIRIFDKARRRGARRILVIFDSTSPIEASTKFRKRHARAKQRYNADEELATVIVMEDEFELVCYLWCKSHSGCVINDAPDLLCAFAHDNETPEPLPMRPARRRPRRAAGGAGSWDWEGGGIFEDGRSRGRRVARSDIT